MIGGYAATEKRYTRSNDFRASDSWLFSYENIDERVMALAIKTSYMLGLQSVAFDFIMDQNQDPLIIEMSYAFGTEGIKSAPGYWDENLRWYKAPFKPEERIIETLLKSISLG